MEVPKFLKNVLIINGAISLFLGFSYITGIINIILDLISFPSFNPLYSYVFGGTLLVFGIFSLLLLKRKNLANIKLFMELIIGWKIVVVLTSFLALQISVPYFIAPIQFIWVNNIIFIFLILIDLFVYRKYW
jgi:hypothetical protein